MLRVIIPMAGSGRRFAEAGYDLPKPMIDVCGKPMIERVMESLTPSSGAEFVRLSRDVVGETEGAVDTLLRCTDLRSDEPVLVANCDQWIAPGIIDDFLSQVPRKHAGVSLSTRADASVMTFNSTNPHHSYVTASPHLGVVSSIAEKRVISDEAVLGVYWFRSGDLLADYAEKAMASGERLNGECYISTIIALMVADGLTVTAFEVDVHDKAMLGTPEELAIFEAKVADGRVVL